MRVFVFSSVLLLLTSSICADQEEKGVEEDDPFLYNEVDFADVESEPHFIMFFAPWCGHCKSLKPTWQELSELYNKQQTDIITIAKVDCTTDTSLCSEYGVTGYPTLKLFQPGKEAIRYQGARNLESLKKFISDTLKLGGGDGEEDTEKPGVLVDEGLHELTADTFDDHISTGVHFVKFFAPWCGHCKRMEPAWKELAAKMKDSSAVKIGRVDCTQHQRVCGSKGVRGYPTLIFFKDGQEVEKYQGNRQLDDFLSYIEKMTGEEKQAPAEEEEKEVVVKQQPDEPEIVDGLFELNVGNYEPLTAEGDFFIKFFAPWCGHCKRMEPAWKELAKFYENNDKVRIGRVDCTKENTLCQSNGVRGYPTLKYFRNGKELTGSPSGRDIENLKKFVETMSAKEEEVKDEVEEKVQEEQTEEEKEEEKGGAVELTDDNFAETIESDGIVFVKFYAPWCGHCKRLAPTWDELATQDFSELSSSVLIAKVDCTKYSPVCHANEVKGYPTLKLFVNGKMKQKYQGGRTLEALVNFVLEHGADAEEEEQQMRDEL